MKTMLIGAIIEIPFYAYVITRVIIKMVII